MNSEDWTKKRSSKCNCGGCKHDTVSIIGTFKLEVDDRG
jgi:hypothetical protein